MPDLTPITSFEDPAPSPLIGPLSPATAISSPLLPRVIFALAVFVGSLIAVFLVRA